MDAKVFNYYLTLCRCRSFVRAARQLGITTQGLSSSMRRLERELGVPLLDPSQSSVALTEYGRLVLGYAERLSDQMGEMRAGLDAMRAHANNVIKIGCSVGLIGYLGEDVFDEFEAGEGTPQILVSDELPDLELETRLLAGDYDFGLLVNPINPELMSVQIVEDYQFFWVNVHHRLASRGEILLGDLEGQVVATVGEDFRNPGRFMRLCEEAGVNVDIRFTGEMMRVYEMARAGMALGLTCRNHIEATAESTRTVGVPFKTLPWGFSLCYRRDHALTEGAARFVDYLRGKRRAYA